MVEAPECNQIGTPDFHPTHSNPSHHSTWKSLSSSPLIPTDHPNENLSNRNKRTERRVFNPRRPNIKRLNQCLVLSRVISLAIDPLFLIALSITGGAKPCIYLDGTMLVFATVLRTCLDLIHLLHIWLKFRTAYLSKESLVIGSGMLVWDTRSIIRHYVRSLKGFWFDLFVVIPAPQVSYHFLLTPYE